MDGAERMNRPVVQRRKEKGWEETLSRKEGTLGGRGKNMVGDVVDMSSRPDGVDTENRVARRRGE
ncbi:uncharacterized protein BDZ83DRAFT_622864 [Colletotrichum acutatum]|uniref:Uncharacterized protein n=1 Tax=Glomerella acutata TaxID=27357 RepID=A0AAD8UHR0_GLOAC|nr:uncharacterized protein BDZ83DRAFT_622864 [Colletotrichum acutatum]KAK1724502.1 hypothetical protein BDZ83DRAFT_622864 [Colletotrichum acutatum]